MSRLSELSRDSLSAGQREVLDAIERGPRGAIGLAGPFGVYVRAAKLGNAAQALGAAARFETELAPNLKEVAICTVGAFFKARFEFAAHAAMAVKAGVDAGAVEAIRCGREPQLEREDEAVVHAVASELLRRHAISERTFERARDLLGERRLVELTLVVGYYCLVSLVLNAFEIPIRDDMDDPFPAHDPAGAS